MQFFSMPQAVKTLGIPYHRIYYAIATGKVKPHSAGHSRILTESDLVALRVHFAGLEARKGATC